MNQAYFFIPRAGFRENNLARITTTFLSDGIRSSSPPPLSQIDQYAQSDCRDGANNKLVMESRVHPIPPPSAPSGITYEGWDIEIEKSFFYLSSPPSIPFLCLFMSLSQNCDTSQKKKVSILSQNLCLLYLNFTIT